MLNSYDKTLLRRFRLKSKYVIANPTNLRQYCNPPESCFNCPFEDCAAGTGTKGFGKRTAGELDYLKIAMKD